MLGGECNVDSFMPQGVCFTEMRWFPTSNSGPFKFSPPLHGLAQGTPESQSLSFSQWTVGSVKHHSPALPQYLQQVFIHGKEIQQAS